MQTGFLIAVSNYVFPTLLSLVQLILVFRNPSPFTIPQTRLWFLQCVYVQNVNNYVTIIGVVFATVWTTGEKWVQEGIDEETRRSVVRISMPGTPRVRESLQGETRMSLQGELGEESGRGEERQRLPSLVRVSE